MWMRTGTRCARRGIGELRCVCLAACTQRINLGTNMLLLPLHHPLRVAEDGAMVDVVSGGRLRLGVSAGYAPADLRAFAVPAGERARRMPAVERSMRLFAERVMPHLGSD